MKISDEMRQLREARERIVREHMESENVRDFDTTIGTFGHPRYELVATGDVYDGEDAVRAYFAESRTAFPDQRNELVALHHADGAVIVTAAHLPSMNATKQALEVLQKLSFPQERTVLVVNRTSAAGVEMDHVARFFNRKPDIVVPYTEACDDAADRGRPLVVLHPESAAAKVVRDLAARIAVAAPAGR